MFADARADVYEKDDSEKTGIGLIFTMFLIALGSNTPGIAGDPQAVLEAALAALEREGMRIAARSRWWRTPAHPPGSGPDFVNGAIRVEASLAPAEVMARLHAVEEALGRTRRRRWEPRICDLDLLAAGDAVLPGREEVGRWMRLDPREQAEVAPEVLLLPHPRMHERGFVLAPLAEVAPDWRHPLTGLTVREMRDALPAEAFAGMTRL